MTKQHNDEFGERMKAYEFQETTRIINKELPVYVRIDGRSFSNFTRGMNRPFDERMSRSMINTTKTLVKETNACIGYTQSDEISLVYLWDKPETDPFFGGKIQKLTSVLASLTTSAFIREIFYNFDDKASLDGQDLMDKLPHFDARVFNLPNRTEAANAVLWRAMDARKNAISMAASSMFSHKELQGKDQIAMKQMMKQKGVEFETFYPEYFRKGTFIQKRSVEVKVDAQKFVNNVIGIQGFPEYVTRSVVETIPMPHFNNVKNRVDVIFDGASPLLGNPVGLQVM